MELSEMLSEMVSREGSDLFISPRSPAYVKVEGVLEALSEPLGTADSRNLIYSVLNDLQRKEFEATRELNISLRYEGVGRFRLNVFQQQGEPALVARLIRGEIPSLESLGVPLLLHELVMEQRGLILLVGGTGTGKSTTLASMIDYRNAHRSGHILTIEDPVEFVHSHKRSVVNQRDVGVDTDSYEIALKNAMREAPDVILIGEVRDRETMKHALDYAETGHLCLSTLHASNAYQALDRIMNFFPDSAHNQIRKDLSSHLKAIVSQRLLKGVDGKRVAAIEVMLVTPFISELILAGKTEEIKEAMMQARPQGCQTFDDHLFDLVGAGKVAPDVALAHADSKNNLSLRFKLEGTGKGGPPTGVKKDVAFSRSGQFREYQSFRLKAVKVTKDMTDRVGIVEQAIINNLQTKGLTLEQSDPDIEVQYVLGSKKRDTLKLQDIENPISSEINLDEEIELQGVLVINMLDMHTKKSVWKVSAAKQRSEAPASQGDMNRHVDYVMSEYPPPED